MVAAGSGRVGLRVDFDLGGGGRNITEFAISVYAPQVDGGRSGSYVAVLLRSECELQH